jgi:3-oxoacyl-[acyl-carrier-protein] synthase-1
MVRRRKGVSRLRDDTESADDGEDDFTASGRANMLPMALALRPLPPCVVTAYSAVNALGFSMPEVAASLSRDKTGLRPGSPTLPVRTYVGTPAALLPELPAALAGHDARLARLAWLALGPISNAVARAVDRWGASRVAIIAGSSTGGWAETEEAFKHYLRESRAPEGYSFDRYSFDALVQFLEQATGARGPRFVVSTACASSAKALGSAQRLLTLGIVDAVLVVGADSLCRTTLHGFGGLRILSAEPCKPFDLHRDGISIGEGAATLLLERSGPGWVHLLSVGESTDAYHVTAPHPEGLGATSAMTLALELARLCPSEIDYVNAHGTGTRVNDQVESDAIAKIFGSRVPVSSTKGLTGHLLGAAGATEAVLTIDALVRGMLPANVGLAVPDPDVTVQLVDRPVATRARRALSNSFGFGGCNATVIVGEPLPDPVPACVPSTIHVVGTAFWAPGTPNVEAWLDGRQASDVTEPPAALLGPRAAGRASVLTRMFAEVIGQIAENGSVDLATVPIVFGSAYGEVSTMVRLLAELEGERVLLSPLKFQASVHNTAAGVLSIETRNRAFSTSVAAGRYTAAMALLEAIAWLGVHGGEAIVALADEATVAFPAPRRPHPAVAMAFHLMTGEHEPPRNSAGRLSSLRRTTNRTAADHGDPRALNPAAGALGLVRSVALRRYGVVPLVEPVDPGWVVDFRAPASRDSSDSVGR